MGRDIETYHPRALKGRDRETHCTLHAITADTQGEAHILHPYIYSHMDQSTSVKENAPLK